ncbi:MULTISPECIES: rod shape-determining protein MreC [unclassified Duganella]|uniref:rod shape-determining protein MreC n=1 Tax=unclassified Duganella TaxID=2636909 RepID=UPI000E354BEF|nr:MULTISPECIES: rod shape-determining protein MreC [unclassified Duganella]RFP10620.1 rod shape-determining protein MreC [Duganella sp. BJB475]RFP27401.1 rod shape-determining protein MreC [Duganella sp. BJB476]
MEYSPPPLFKQGASARVKMTVFACISIALLLVDSRMHTLTTVRKAAATVLYPLQMAALLPRDAIYGVGDYFSTLSALEKQVRELKRQQIAGALVLQQAQLQTAENGQLRRLMDAREHLPVKSMLAEILYDARDVNSRKVILDRGTQQGVALGLPVIDNQGVVGQVTRVFPFTSEVTLLTDKEQAIPVQLLRNGLRSVAYGRGKSGALELRFTAPNADIQVGDIVVTSGLDGVYPAGLAVARVSQVENSAAGSFGGVVCQPLAGIANNTQLLILMSTPEMPPRPPDEELRALKKHNNKMAPIKEAPKEGVDPAPAGTAPAPAPAGPPGLMPVMPPPAPKPAPAATPAANAPTNAVKPATGTPAPEQAAPPAAPPKEPAR